MKNLFKSFTKRIALAMTMCVCVVLAFCFTGCDLLNALKPPHEHSYTDNVVSPTCTEQGYTEHICSCGDKKTDTFVSAIGHSYANYISNGDGTKTGSCVRNCGATDTKPETALVGEISFHFPMLGNASTGDCTFIEAGDTDILIDCGSQVGSAEVVKKYLDDNNLVDDGVLEFVIVTHADEDHIAGFSSTGAKNIFKYYECEIIIDFNLTNKELVSKNGNDTTYGKYVKARDNEVSAGAKHYTALDCYNNQNGAQRSYTLSDSITMQILYNYYYENYSGDENNYSVCTLFSHGERNFLFTGDLEKEGEEYLVQYNTLPEVELYKAGHHGSRTSSNNCLLDVIKPKVCVVCCCAGTDEYSQDPLVQFPSQPFIDRISKHTDKVYVPLIGDTTYTGGEKFAPLNGNIKVVSNQIAVSVTCSVSDILLKDTDWFKDKRIMPDEWKTD